MFKNINESYQCKGLKRRNSVVKNRRNLALFIEISFIRIVAPYFVEHMQASLLRECASRPSMCGWRRISSVAGAASPLSYTVESAASGRPDPKTFHKRTFEFQKILKWRQSSNKVIGLCLRVGYPRLLEVSFVMFAFFVYCLSIFCLSLISVLLYGCIGHKFNFFLKYFFPESCLYKWHHIWHILCKVSNMAHYHSQWIYYLAAMVYNMISYDSC